MRTQKYGDNDAALRRLRMALDVHIDQVVKQAYANLNDIYSPMIRYRLWRRLILWSRARVAARRVLMRRATLYDEEANVHESVGETVCD